MRAIVTFLLLIFSCSFAVSRNIDGKDYAAYKLVEPPAIFKRLAEKRNNKPEEHIVGGIESIPHSRPYQVALRIPVSAIGTSFCGGSLINARTILTAAHCVDNAVANVSIILGAHNVTLPVEADNATIVTSGDIVIHPNWTRSVLLHDIALIRLAEPVQLSERISPILLPRLSNQNDSYLGNTSLVSGWGRPADSVNTISPVLREVTSVVISNFACRLAYFGLIEESHICISGDQYRGTCNGDSGGPLTINGVQVGVVSFGSGFGCEQGWPPAFARVTYYLDWIHQFWAE